MRAACRGSAGFPTNFDGENTVCDICGRTLPLRRDGLLPKHTSTPPPRRHDLLPRGEAIIDGRRTGGPHNPGPAQEAS